MEVSATSFLEAHLPQPKLLRVCNLKPICPTSTRTCDFLARNRRQKSVRAAMTKIPTEILRSQPLQGERILRKQDEHVQLFVGLPLDAVSSSNNLNHSKAITAGLKALKLLGVHGVELPLWWGIVEKEAQGEYEWARYMTLAEMVRDAGLKLHVSLCFHASLHPVIPLPLWVTRIGGTQPDIFFTDRSGKRYRECLSLSVDELPVLEGKTPLQVFDQFLRSFKSSFSSFMGSTITNISVGLGPEGELRYPSFPSITRRRESLGAGEFQCYDKHILHHLRLHAESCGKPLWGCTGPHDAPNYDESPCSNSFFREQGGSWETPYGDFFLSWYASQLLAHGDRLLSLASSTFRDFSVTISGKVPLMPAWYKFRSHPSELTAGYYNTAKRDGYDAVAEMFARNSCRVILPGIELSDQSLPQGSHSAPGPLIAQITEAFRRHGILMSGESSVSGFKLSSRFENIKSRLSSFTAFTYLRMGAVFFSPEHFPLFCQFVRLLQHSEQFAERLLADEDVRGSSLSRISDQSRNLQMQNV